MQYFLWLLHVSSDPVPKQYTTSFPTPFMTSYEQNDSHRSALLNDWYLRLTKHYQRNTCVERLACHRHIS